ncbi:FAD-dependent oxidoreductase [Quadrisphaera sp. KR29]|uniref:FAD-dependent oxidoreductase n=1 Tax=Quadrisphaera sp. KR29 TaxID=3461391 RepID=UPI00404396C4
MSEPDALSTSPPPTSPAPPRPGPASPGSAAAARPALLTVDDDPSVSRAVARDLRRRYGERYRVVRAESGPAALEALRDLALRGQPVAVLLADHRMPGMSGIEFLEQAMDLHPAARRVLLTAYADTSAAIDAINLVDLDHYLLKPWDPPEEKLYPVIDALLEAWRRDRRATERGRPEVKVVGDRWSPDFFALRDFLARNQVPYRSLPSDHPEAGLLLAATGAEGLALPVVVLPDGGWLERPTEARLAAAVGLHTTADADFYDLVVVGGGPAGLGAAVYGASEGLRTVLLERSATGGQAGQSSRIENYLGFPDGVSGAQLTDRARRQVDRFGVEVITAGDAVALEAEGPARTVVLSDGSRVSGHAVVLATGVSYRTLDVPGVEALTGAGVYYGSALTEAAGCEGADVHVVGGANSAGQAAVFLAGRARSVTVLVRGAGLEATMSDYLVKQLAALANVTVRTGTEVVEARGEGRLQRLVLATPQGREEVPSDRLFVFIGAAPRTDWLDGTAVRDERGYVVAGPDLLRGGDPPPGWDLQRDPYHLEASVPGVFVAGDVRSGSVKRVASAVGEGAMAVTLVHRYLEQR